MIAFSPSNSIHHCIKGPETLAGAEFYCMVGVPAAGKSTWAEQFAQKNPDKRYDNQYMSGSSPTCTVKCTMCTICNNESKRFKLINL